MTTHQIIKSTLTRIFIKLRILVLSAVLFVFFYVIFMAITNPSTFNALN